jgi:hypothetical protein
MTGSVEVHLNRAAHYERRLTDHLERAPDDAAQDVAEPEAAVERVRRELGQLGQRVLVEHEPKLSDRPAAGWCWEVDDGGDDVEKRLEADLGEDLGRLRQVGASRERCPREEVLDQPRADVEAPKRDENTRDLVISARRDFGQPTRADEERTSCRAAR